MIPMVLVILDGLGDRPLPELDDRTPAEAASTPNLDRLARAGASGIHLPFGWGRAASSEVAHWALLGYGEMPFCGRAVLEAIGHGRDVPHGRPTFYAALRPPARTGSVRMRRPTTQTTRPRCSPRSTASSALYRGWPA